MKFTAVIITFNEERNIERCVQSLVPLTDDIVVVDSFSEDATVDICHKYGARVFQRSFAGYSDQKNWANSQANYDYIFSIDADEVVSAELQQSIQNIQEPLAETAFIVNRLTNYCGKWIRHGGWYPDKKTRLWNKNNAIWVGLIHETVSFKKPVATIHLNGDLQHYSYISIDAHRHQAIKFAKLSSVQMFENCKKTTLLTILVAPAFRFLKTYLFKGGFLDGYYGFVIAKISARATFYKHLWLYKKKCDKNL